ncbi:hypothetical protein [Agriterribacter sp.]|uniref:hypothetical protein n=1 Tax=Agriterribacter sp. TaxID=2821509 RepID=UPI002BE60DBA|nr:hypothetical protein [Agriterribacter sp.]HTN07028.1 hypothetical protein [Agriterribacter sp.]
MKNKKYLRLSTGCAAIFFCTIGCYLFAAGTVGKDVLLPAEQKAKKLDMTALLPADAHTNNPTVSEKVLKAFRETYTTAQQVSWHEKGDQYSVSFLQLEIRYIVNYNNDGHVTGVMRFYKPALLPANILLEIKRRYSTKTAFGVTEITSGENLTYFVKMEDSKHLYTVKLDAYGNGRVYEKVRKQQ